MGRSNDKEVVSYQLLMIEIVNENSLLITAAVFLEGMVLEITKMDANTLAGRFCRGECNILDFDTNHDGQLLEHFKDIIIEHYDSCLHPQKTVVCEIENSGPDRLYLIVNEDEQLEAISDLELNENFYLNTDTQNGEKVLLPCRTPIRKFMVPNGFLRTNKKRAEYLKFTQKPFIQGRVSLSNSMSRELLKCTISKQTAKVYSIKIPKYIKSIGHHGIVFNNINCDLTFDTEQLLRADSIRVNGDVGMRILKMSSAQILDSRLSFLHSGKVKIQQLSLTTAPNEEETLAILDIITSLARYISIEGLFDKTDIPTTFGKVVIAELKCLPWSEVYDRSEMVYKYSRELSRWIMHEVEVMLADCQGDEMGLEEEDKRNLMEYTKEIIETNCLLVRDTIPALLQELCTHNLTTDDKFSVYQLGSALYDECMGLYTSVFFE